MVLFHHIFSQFSSIVEIGPFYKYLQLLVCILVDLRWVYQLTISKRSDKQWLRFKGGTPPPPPLDKICKPKWLDHQRVKSKIYILPMMPCKKCTLNFKKQHLKKIKKKTGYFQIIASAIWFHVFQ